MIMTARRPVPLEHFLYTGQDGKTKKDMFKIIDSNGQFLQKGYQLDIGVTFHGFIFSYF